MAKEYGIDDLISSEELYHHGIKGQKWGVRRFQNKNGSLTPAGKDRYYVESDKKEKQNDNKSSTIPKGYKFNRVGGANLDVNRSGALYVSSGKADASRYMKMLGPTPLSKLLGTYSTHVQHLEVTGDIKKASASETARISVDILSRNPKMLHEINDSIHAMAAGVEFDKKTLRKAQSNPGGKEAMRLALGVSAVLGDGKNYGHIAKVVYDEFKKNGYDAIPDLNDTMTGRSETATIIVNPNKIKVTSTTEITKDIMKEGKNYLKTVSKLPVSKFLEEDDDE